MKRLNSKCLVPLALIFQILMSCPLYAANELSPGTTLPKFKMKAPQDPEQCKYLGIQGKKKFTLTDVPAKLIVIEFFNVVCPKCHAQAPKANQIYTLIEGNPEFKQDVKMLAVGLMAEPNQLTAFRKKFNISFPLIADEDEKVIDTLRISAIPQTLIVDKNGKVLFNHMGYMKGVDDFLAEIRKFLNQQ